MNALFLTCAVFVLGGIVMKTTYESLRSKRKNDNGVFILILGTLMQIYFLAMLVVNFCLKRMLFYYNPWCFWGLSYLLVFKGLKVIEENKEILNFKKYEAFKNGYRYSAFINILIWTLYIIVYLL